MKNKEFWYAFSHEKAFENIQDNAMKVSNNKSIAMQYNQPLLMLHFSLPATPPQGVFS
ncbi:MAG: hypothetical protein PHR75_06055 [Sulfurovum sp.]|nr:hypothetical protein [Sulfurovum sp.]MDD3602500.1 hypothetical protein [Sulfurovum sp.]